MKIVRLWLKWLCSNSGALRGSRDKTQIDGQTMLIYVMGKHPLIMKECPYCEVDYWAFTKGNKYCGRFKCFKGMYESK